MSKKYDPNTIGSPAWNDQMFDRHPTPYKGIAGWIEYRRLQAIVHYLRKQNTAPTSTLLEIGCEAGHLLLALHQAFPTAPLLGFDISAAALDQARQRLPNAPLQLIQGDCTQPIQIPSIPDVIICSETLEHVPDYQAAIRQIAALGHDDSLFVFTVPLERLKNQVKTFLRKLGLFDLFFRGIEKGMSEWHVNDFAKADFLNLLAPHFELLEYRQLLGLHQFAFCKKKKIN